MGLSGGPACVKYLLFIFNLIFVISGIIVISVGAVVQGSYYKYETVMDDRLLTVPALLIATGCIILIISFFGCCGALKENHCMTITFSVLLFLIFILELAAGISGYILRSEVEVIVEKNLNKTMLNYTDEFLYREFWDDIQRELECCGLKDYNSWNFLPNHSLPMSCCHIEYGTIGEMQCNDLNTTNVFQDGCLEKMVDFVKDNSVALGGVGIGIATVQLLGIILACCLAKSIRKHYETV